VKSTNAIAAGIALVLGIWLASGQFKSTADTAEAQMSPGNVDPAPTVSIRTRRQKAELHAVEVTLRGRTEAKRIVSVRAETTGQVVELPVSKGAMVKKGDLLCKLSLDDRDIKLEEAQAAVIHARLEHQGALKLAKQGFQSETKIANERVELIRAQANLRRRQLDYNYREIRAPFDGIVEDRMVDIGDYLQKGGICAEIMDADPLIVVAHVTERDVSRIQIGTNARAKLASGEVIHGRTSFIGHAADPTTRTYRVEVEIANHDSSLRDGLSAELVLPLNSLLAHRVSPALLSLDDDGEIGIRILDQNNIVHLMKVAILSDTQDGIWLTGLPESIRLITHGQETVFDGQKIEISDEAR
jgi:multidrug efflux system membrane fusion protein